MCHSDCYLVQNQTKCFFKVVHVHLLGNTNPLYPVSVSGQSFREAVQRRGDALRCPDHPHLPKPLSPGAPRVPLGPKSVQLSQPGGRETVRPDGAAPHKLRAHVKPHPAGGGQLRGAVQTQRGRAAETTGKALQQQRPQTT